jgi:type IV pilus assembly protein PilV
MSKLSSQRGVTLIEVLITVLVLSVGLLGVAALNAFSLQAGQSSLQRTQASIIAGETLDWLRANRGYYTIGAPDIDGLEVALETRYAAQSILPCLNIEITKTGDQFDAEIEWLVDRAIESEEACPEEGMTSLAESSTI